MHSTFACVWFLLLPAAVIACFHPISAAIVTVDAPAAAATGQCYSYCCFGHRHHTPPAIIVAALVASAAVAAIVVAAAADSPDDITATLQAM